MRWRPSANTLTSLNLPQLDLIEALAELCMAQAAISTQLGQPEKDERAYPAA